MEGKLFLSATLIDDASISIIDSIPGLVSINPNGETDVLFSVDGELIWLSDFSESDVIDNTGWFKDLIKKITNGTVNGVSAIVKALEPIIRPAVKISYYLAVKLIGNDNAAYWGGQQF